MAEVTGGEVLARMLQKEGVEKVFGIIDSHVVRRQLKLCSPGVG